jgi:signal transduction histidine kinase
LSDEVDKVVYHLSEAARAKKITITPEIDEALQVYADEHMIDTVIRNLLSNSIKFTQAEGKIIISAKSNKDEAIISVTDNGVGMKKETINKLFANTTYTTYGTQGEKGTGLGLELCKDFVNKLGGKIWVESVYGKGSTFSFSVRSLS